MGVGELGLQPLDEDEIMEMEDELGMFFFFLLVPSFYKKNPGVRLDLIANSSNGRASPGSFAYVVGEIGVPWSERVRKRKRDNFS